MQGANATLPPPCRIELKVLPCGDVGNRGFEIPLASPKIGPNNLWGPSRGRPDRLGRMCENPEMGGNPWTISVQRIGRATTESWTDPEVFWPKNFWNFSVEVKVEVRP